MSPGPALSIALRMAFSRSGSTRLRRVEAPDADHGVIHDANGVLRPRIIGGEHDDVAQLRGSHAHQRALCAIPVTSAAE